MRLTIILLSAAVLAGCTYQSSYTAADQDRTAVSVSGATGLRNFEPTVATYVDGGAVAGSTTFAYEPARYQKNWQYLYADSGTFFANFFTMPFTLFREAPDKRYDGLMFEPSHTMNPAQSWTKSSMASAPVAAEASDTELMVPASEAEAPASPEGVIEITP